MTRLPFGKLHLISKGQRATHSNLPPAQDSFITLPIIPASVRDDDDDSTRNMTMTIDNNQQRFPLSFDHMSSYQTSQPQFTNPWVSSNSASSHPQTSHQPMPVYQQAPPPPPPQQHQPPVSRTAGAGAYGSIPVSTAPAGSSLSMPDHHSAYVGQQDLLSIPQDLLTLNRLPHTSGPGYPEAAYTTAPSPIHSTYAASPTNFDQLGYAPAPIRSTFAMADQDQRRYSQSSVPFSSCIEFRCSKNEY